MAKEVIPYIHNYCNRWCERCPLGHRCAIFEQNIEAIHNPEAFWQSLQENLKETGEKLQAMMLEAGMDMVEVEEEDMATAVDETNRIRSSPLIRRASVTGEKIATLANRLHPLLQDEENQFLQFNQLEINTLTEERHLHRVQNAFDILCWYRYFIEVKLSRALKGKEDEEDDPIQNDSNGSAKIARIAIVHCLKAGKIILNDITEAEEECLAMLILLQKLLKAVDQEFPNAADFIRPGFDTLEIGENLGV